MANPIATFDTSLGSFQAEIYLDKMPITAQNFLDLAEAGFYDGLHFHRVIDGFMIQGGGFTADMKQKKTNPSIKNESSNGLENKKYTLAMARTSVPDSATSQFFINTTDNDFLDKSRAQDGVGYAVFGRVVEGQAVVDKIGKTKTGVAAGMRDVPTKAISIQSVEVVEAST